MVVDNVEVLIPKDVALAYSGNSTKFEIYPDELSKQLGVVITHNSG